MRLAQLILFTILYNLPFVLSGPETEKDGYDRSLVSFYKTDDMAIVKIARVGTKIKVRYFAGADEASLSTPLQYKTWAPEKNIVGYLSGAYMNQCSTNAGPVGLCIESGRVINKAIRRNLEGLVIISGDGSIYVCNLHQGSVSVSGDGGNTRTYDIMNNSLQLGQFVEWCRTNAITLYQTHLLVENDQLDLSATGSAKLGQRRMIAICKESNRSLTHYLFNITSEKTLYEATMVVKNYLNRQGSSILYLFNSDTGCQNVFCMYNYAGYKLTDPLFQGDVDLNQASNLLVYYSDLSD